jgi:hypothetical protein
LQQPPKTQKSAAFFLPPGGPARHLKFVKEVTSAHSQADEKLSSGLTGRYEKSKISGVQLVEIRPVVPDDLKSPFFHPG